MADEKEDKDKKPGLLTGLMDKVTGKDGETAAGEITNDPDTPESKAADAAAEQTEAAEAAAADPQEAETDAAGETLIKELKVKNPQSKFGIFQLFKTADGKYGWRLLAMNYEPVGRASQDYVGRKAAEENAVLLLASWRLLNGLDFENGMKVVKDIV